MQFTQWGRVSLSLSQSGRENARVQQERRHLENQTRQAANRLSIVQSLLQWSEQGSNTNVDLQRTRQIVAVMALSNIIQALPSDAADFQTMSFVAYYGTLIAWKNCP